MVTSLTEMGRLVSLTFQPEAAYKPVESTVSGEPQAVLGMPGLFGTASHLADVREATLKRLPHGSRMDLYRPTTGVNLALWNLQAFGVPRNQATELVDLREQEVPRVVYEMDRLADEHGGPITVVSHSLSGAVALAAWGRLREPERVARLVTAASPHRYFGIGVPERPDTGELHTIGGRYDWVVPPPFYKHDRHDRTDLVASNHMGFLAGDVGVKALVEAVVHPVYPQANVA